MNDFWKGKLSVDLFWCIGYIGDFLQRNFTIFPLGVQSGGLREEEECIDGHLLQREFVHCVNS